MNGGWFKANLGLLEVQQDSQCTFGEKADLESDTPLNLTAIGLLDR